MPVLFDAVVEVCDRTIVSTQIRSRGPEYTRYHVLFRENGYSQKLADCNFELGITRDWEEILGDMASSRRLAIKQSHANDAEIANAEGTDWTMAEFYDGFRSVMERVNGNAPLVQFFLELTEFGDRITVFSLRAESPARTHRQSSMSSRENISWFHICSIT